MQKKQNYNYFSLLWIIFYLSSAALAAGLLSACKAEKIEIKNESKQSHFNEIYTTKDRSKSLFTHKLKGLSDEELDRFILGKSFFRIPWVEAPSATTARDGLGPLFSANSCISCHPNNGAGSVYNSKGDISRAYVSRLSISDNRSEKHKVELKMNGFIKDPKYGNQISINGTQNVVFEGKPVIKYKKVKITYPDGKVVFLNKPIHGLENQLTELNYGNPHQDMRISNRIAQALIGMGLLSKLTDKQILENEDINDNNKDGISGKANRVYSLEFKDYRVGRFTWKASVPTIRQQVAGAANNDMSLTSSLFPDENCTDFQEACNKAPKGDSKRAGTPFDLPDNRLDAITFYLEHLKIPQSIITEKKGEKLFEKIGCAKCHIESFKLDNGYEIKPFSDLLLHDMGEALSDGRKEFLASEREWRTAPLWALGKYKKALGKDPDLLHDGRAKTIEEAILWHGGEGEKSKLQFMNLSNIDREKLIKYIKEL